MRERLFVEAGHVFFDRCNSLFERVETRRCFVEFDDDSRHAIEVEVVFELNGPLKQHVCDKRKSTEPQHQEVAKLERPL